MCRRSFRNCSSQSLRGAGEDGLLRCRSMFFVLLIDLTLARDSDAFRALVYDLWVLRIFVSTRPKSPPAKPVRSTLRASPGNLPLPQ